MEFNELQIVIVISSIVLLTVLIVAIALFSLFQKKKLSFILREKEKEKQFQETLTKSQIEIRENALKNIAWELHDNVGQLLTLARLKLGMLHPKSVNNADEISEINDIVGISLEEIRALSKILNEDIIKDMGLVEAIQLEIDRFNRLNFIKTDFRVEGVIDWIKPKDEIILFRIIQEFLSNTIKHAQATQLHISIKGEPERIRIEVADNGRGFDIKTAQKGSGLINMQARANLINTKITITSGTKGTVLRLSYPKERTITHKITENY